MAHVAEYKKEIVKNIIDLSSQYPIIGVVNMENLPAPQLQKMRAQLRDRIKFAMTKKRLIKIALEQLKGSKKDIENLKGYFTGMPALIFTKENPFKLFNMLKKNKSPAPAKAGQTAPKDIIVPAGPTSFAPGPIIGELGQIGIKTGVEGGKVAVKFDSVVAKKGEKIKPKVAEILTRLGIEPMEVGLDLVATYEDGTIYSKEILDIDEDRFMADLRRCANGAFNLAMFVAYPTKETVEHLISKAFNDSKALGLSQNIIDEGIIDALLGKAQRQMLSLSSIAKIEVKEKQKEKKEEAKPEVKEEKKPEVEEEKKPEIKEEKPVIKKEEKKEEVKEEKKPEVYVPEIKEKELEEAKKAEEEKRKAEEAKKAEEKRKQEEKKAEELKRKEEERKKKEELKKQEELRRQKELEEKKKDEEEKREQEKVQKLEEEKKREEQRRQEELKKQEERKRVEEQRRKEEERRKAEEAKKAEEKRKLEEQKRAEEEKRKQEELKRQEEERKRAEEQEKKEAEKKEDIIDIKVREMVEKTKKMAQGPGPTASDILEQVAKEQPAKKTEAKEEAKKEIKKEQPEAERLLQELQRKGTLRGIRAEEPEKKRPEAKKEKKDDEQKKVEDLVEQLKRKGTLRK